MDSTIFNRRTLLGSGALVGLGALLAACGQQANNEAAATASAAPSETGVDAGLVMQPSGPIGPADKALGSQSSLRRLRTARIAGGDHAGSGP